jgi:hypothetical protein
MIPLLRLDPQLGCFVAPERRAAAQSALPVRVARVQPGEWQINGDGKEHLGVLLLDGVVAHDVLMGGVASTELLGPRPASPCWTAGSPCSSAPGPRSTPR